jgi:hypothetical protein
VRTNGTQNFQRRQIYREIFHAGVIDTQRLHQRLHGHQNRQHHRSGLCRPYSGSLLINDGIEAYDAGYYRDALDVYLTALKTPGGEQLRVLNGIYIANYRLHHTKAARDAFGNVIDYGLKSATSSPALPSF